MKTIALLLCFLPLSGCIMQQRMQQWQDKHKDELIATWGPPDRERTLSNGSTTLLYSYTWGLGMDGAYTGNTCRMIFTTDKDQIIRQGVYSGC